MTEEHKQKLKAGREKQLQEKNSLVKLKPKDKIKPILKISGEEKTALDFWKPLRHTFRPLKMYEHCKDIEVEIVDPAIWQNIQIVKTKLQKYVTLEIIPPKEPKKGSKKGK